MMGTEKLGKGRGDSMNWVYIGAAEEIKALGIGIMPPAVAIGIAAVFAGLMLLFFLKNR